MPQPSPSEPLRICLLTYRGNPRSGGQGIYVRQLARALCELGHDVDVWSGPPYPELTGGARLRRVPSLDLWRNGTPLHLPPLHRLKDPINLSEWAATSTGAFAEPLTFSRRMAREHRLGRMPRYDVVHDNQSLGPGLLELRRHLPVVSTIHHPITVDRRLAHRAASGYKARFGVWRFYSFIPAQQRVARRLDRVLTVSEASQRDIERELEVPPHRTRVVGNGIDVDVFRPLPRVQRASNRLVCTLSSDQALKGFRYLLDALAILRESRPDLHLVVVGGADLRPDTRARIRRLGLEGAVELTGRVPAETIAQRYASATVAVVPSLYEGFGYPAGEAMACGVPVVATEAGALPEVVGRDGETGLLVEPGSGEALARAIGRLLDDQGLRARLAAEGRRRVLERFTWRRSAERTVDAYREAIARRAPRREPRAC